MFILLVTTLLSVLIGNNLGFAFDVVFVLVCIGAALWVRPRDFFMVGVMPPLLLAGTVALLAFFDRGAVARPDDTLVQAFVTGLAHHAGALVLGYALTLGLLALRQLALGRHGALRRPRGARVPAPDTATGPTTGPAVTTAADALEPDIDPTVEPDVEPADSVH